MLLQTVTLCEQFVVDAWCPIQVTSLVGSGDHEIIRAVAAKELPTLFYHFAWDFPCYDRFVLRLNQPDCAQFAVGIAWCFIDEQQFCYSATTISNIINNK